MVQYEDIRNTIHNRDSYKSIYFHEVRQRIYDVNEGALTVVTRRFNLDRA